MIESGMVPIIIARDQKAEDAVGKLGVANIPSGAIARELQTFIVQVPPKARAHLLVNGRVSFHRPDLRGDQFAVLDDSTLYREDTGLIWEDADYLSMESLVM